MKNKFIKSTLILILGGLITKILAMVIKIFFPNLQVYLVDSNNKKTKFLLELKDKLNVDKLEVINNRIENITSRFINNIDVVTARAVTNLPVLLELALP